MATNYRVIGGPFHGCWGPGLRLDPIRVDAHGGEYRFDGEDWRWVPDELAPDPYSAIFGDSA